MEEPEPRVIRAAVHGDLDAFEELVRTFQAPVWRFLRSMVRDPALAEDLTQEVFLRTFDRLGSFRFQSRFSTWLFQVAHNLAVDALRRRERSGQLLARLGPVGQLPDTSLRTEVAAAVDALSDKLREALLLVEVMGFSCREAGDILGIAEGTVKSRLHHGRARLVAWFEQADRDDGLGHAGDEERRSREV